MVMVVVVMIMMVCIYPSYLDDSEEDNLVRHLVHLLLVSLHKAVAKLVSHLGRLLYN